VHTTFLGGGFGRRAAQDFIVAALEASKAVGAPVKVVYSREDDMRAAFYRPISYTEVTGGVDEQGNAVMLGGKIVVPSLAEFTGFKRLVRPDGVDRVAVEGLADIAYGIPNIRFDWVKHDFGVPIWFWRSVGATHNTFVAETFIDEMAALAGKDPYEFRRGLLAKQPRLRGVLDLAAEKAGWGRPLPEGVGRGIACVEVFGGWTAQVVEASVKDSKAVVHRVVCATDCGRAVNPEQVKAQMESAIVYALSAALYSRITFKDGKVEQGNFDDYPVVRMSEMPKIEVHLVASQENPGGDAAHGACACQCAVPGHREAHPHTAARRSRPEDGVRRLHRTLAPAGTARLGLPLSCCSAPRASTMRDGAVRNSETRANTGVSRPDPRAPRQFALLISRGTDYHARER